MKEVLYEFTSYNTSFIYIMVFSFWLIFNVLQLNVKKHIAVMHI